MFHRVFVLAILCCSFDSIKCSQRHIALVDIVRMGEDYHGHIHVDGNPIKLNLTRPGTTIFTPEFRLTAATADQWGNVIYEDITPTVNLTHVEESIYEDEEANAIFRVHHVDGKIRMHGIMDNIHIAHDGEDHFAVIHDYSTPPKASGKDYIPIEGPLEFDSSVEPRQMSTVYPELYITVDNKMWRDLKQDNSYTLAYLSVFMRGVNNRYKTVSDPSIQYRVVTATILNSTTVQPFIEKSRKSDGKCDMLKALEGFSDHMYRNAGNLPKHDLAPLLSGEDYGATAGLAWLGGVCRDGVAQDRKTKISYRTSVSRDRGGAYAGIHTVSHELAHNMGAPHDGEKSSPEESRKYDTTGCPWNDGYIMSYIWNARNKLTFSSCSRFYMREIIRSKQGECVTKSQATSTWGEASRDPGEYMSMNEQCQRREGRSDARVYSKSTPDALCLELHCEWPTPGGGGYTNRKQKFRALDGSSCGTSGKRCREGSCV